MTREPIPNCPQPETPIRGRAWTEGQKSDMHREAFERWAKDCRLYSLEREDSEPQIYRDCMTSAAWHGFRAAMRYRDEQEQTSVWRCYKEYMSGDGGCVHSEKFAKTKADMLIFKSQGYDCEKLSDEQEKQA